MTEAGAGALFVVCLVVALVAVYRPFGDYLFRSVSGTRSLRAELVVYRLIGADPAAEQSWAAYARSVLAFSAVSVLFLYGLQRVQDHLWLNLGRPPVAPASVVTSVAPERFCTMPAATKATAPTTQIGSRTRPVILTRSTQKLPSCSVRRPAKPRTSATATAIPTAAEAKFCTANPPACTRCPMVDSPE